MPFSRSRSIESMTRSLTSWFSRKAPDCQSIASTSVVLPWSTCATIATFRRSVRRAVTPSTVGAGTTCRVKREGDPMPIARALLQSWTRRAVVACCAVVAAVLLVGPSLTAARTTHRPSPRWSSRCWARERPLWTDALQPVDARAGGRPEPRVRRGARLLDPPRPGRREPRRHRRRLPHALPLRSRRRAGGPLDDGLHPRAGRPARARCSSTARRGRSTSATGSWTRSAPTRRSARPTRPCRRRARGSPATSSTTTG